MNRDWPTLGLTLLCFAVYSLICAPGVTWFDAGELAGAGFTLGISHPPGQPLHALLAKLASLLPLGSVAFRINLLSAAAAAVCVGLLFRLCRELFPGPAGLAGGLVAAVALGVNRAFVTQALRTEVYTLLLLLLLLALLFGLRLRPLAPEQEEPSSRLRQVLAVALVLGLAAALHPLLALLFGLPLAIAMGRWLGLGRSLRWAPLALAAALVGLLVNLYLPVRASADPAILFGAPDSLVGFWAMMTGSAYAQNFQPAFATVIRHTGGHLALLADVASIPALLACLLGVVLLWRRRVGPLALAIILLTLAAAVLQRRFFFQNPDILGYLLPAIALLCLCTAAALPVALEIFQNLPLRSRVLLGVGLGLALIFVAGKNSLLDPADSRAGDDGPDDYGAVVTTAITPGPALLVAHSDHAIFTLWYDQAVRGLRPDVAVVAHHLVGSTAHHYRHHLKRRFPWLFVPYVDDGGNRIRMRDRLVTVNAARRPVYAERPDGRRALGPRNVTDCGALFAVRGHPAPAPCSASVRLPRYAGRSGRLVSCFISTSRARFHLARGLPARAERELHWIQPAIRPGGPARRLGANEDGPFLCDPAEAAALYGTALWLRGRREDGLPVLKRAIAIDPLQEQANTLLGFHLARTGRLPQAVERLRAAVKGNSKSVQAWFYLGVALRLHGKKNEARQALSRARALDPEGFERLKRASQKKQQ